MARYSIEGQILTDMADAIRDKRNYGFEVVQTVISSTPGANPGSEVYHDGSYEKDKKYYETITIPEAERLNVVLKYTTSFDLRAVIYIYPGWDGVGDVPKDVEIYLEYGNNKEYQNVFENINTLTICFRAPENEGYTRYGYYATIDGEVLIRIKPEEMAEEIRNITVGGSDLAEAIVNRTLTEYSNSELLKLNDYVFYGCQSLTSIDCPNLKTIGNYALTKTALTQIDFPLVTSVGEYAFEAISTSKGTLTSVNLPAATSVGAYAFRYQILESITLPSLTTIGGYRVFELCKSLVRADFGPLKAVNNYCFNSCSLFETLILRNTTMTTLSNTNALTGTKIASGTGYIYVPSALLDSYKAATNWTTYADQFRAIEDYPDICG